MADTEPTAVVSRYRRYKAGTKKVVGWLARSASTCCDVAAKFSCFQSGSTSRSEIKVPSKVLTALADIIASAEADVAVPKHILQVLEDVIELRTECATWYGAQAVSDSTDLAARNKSHQHFIKVLKEVHAMLSKSTNIQASATTTSQSEENKSSKSKKNKKGPRKNSLDKLANLFEMLDLEEPILTPLGEAPSPSSKPPNEWNGKSLSLEDDQDNEAVALWYFLTDMNDVRQNVRQLWLEYLEGQTRLAVAGMVTETALGMIERASNDFVRQWPGFTDWMSMPEYLRITIGINNNLVYLFCKYSNALTKHAAANPSPADLICPTASFLLRTFAEGAWTFQQSLTTSDSGSLGGHVDGNRLSAERPYSEFEEVLLFMLPALTSLKTWKECYELTKRPTQLNLSIHDHSKITDGLMSLIDANQDIPVLDTPIWLVFACQICMDINEVVQGMGTCGADGLLKTTTDIQNSLNEALTWVQKEMNVSAFATRKSEFQLLESLVAGFKDNIKTIRRLESAKKISPLDTDDTWVLYKSRCTIPGLEVLPYRAALMIHAFKDWSYDLLTGVGNDDHAIVAMAHLYGAAKGRGLLQVPWEDMIFLERIQSGRKPLVTKTRNEASIMEYLRHYAIDLGADVAATIKPEFPANLDWKRMLKNGKQVSNRLSELRWAFRERHEENQVLGHQRGNTYDVVLATFTDRRKREDQARGSMKSSSGQIKYSPLQLLQTLTGYSKRDEPRVNFDYAGFSRLCQMTMRDMLQVAGLKKERHMATRSKFSKSRPSSKQNQCRSLQRRWRMSPAPCGP